MFYEVYSVVDGALDESITTDEGFAERRADDLADDLRAFARNGQVTDWKVYILPHYCDTQDDDCQCAQWLTDHTPYASSEETLTYADPDVHGMIDPEEGDR